MRQYVDVRRISILHGLLSPSTTLPAVNCTIASEVETTGHVTNLCTPCSLEQASRCDLCVREITDFLPVARGAPGSSWLRDAFA